MDLASDLGLMWMPGQCSDDLDHPPVFTEPAKIIAEWDRIYGLYDLLIPAFVAQQSGATNSGAVKAEAREYVDMFSKHAGNRPLQSPFFHFGREFIDRGGGHSAEIPEARFDRLEAVFRGRFQLLENGAFNANGAADEPLDPPSRDARIRAERCVCVCMCMSAALR